MGKVSDFRGRSKDTAGKISLKFCTINYNFLRLISDEFYCHNIDTTDGRVLSLIMHK
jgi:hypothetical protein